MPVRSPELADLYQEEIYNITGRVVIVVTEPWGSISHADKTLLTKILGAVNLSLDGVHIIVQSENESETLSNIAPKWVIKFSSHSSDSQPYYIVTPGEGFFLIKSHNLSDLDDVRKKSLWTALKELIKR